MVCPHSLYLLVAALRVHRHMQSMMQAVDKAVAEPPPTSSSSSTSSTRGSSGGGKVTAPTRVSPSSVADYKTCPQLYRFRYIDRVPEPPKEVMVRGSMIHEALELLYEQQPVNRTVSVLQNLFRKVWLKDRDKYMADLFPTIAEQREFGLEGLRLLENYYKLENPTEREPLMRECRMNVVLEGGPNVTGIVDRVDEEDGALVVVDYKTGKAPDLKYSEAVNDRIIQDKFFQLKVYALMVKAKTDRLPSKLKLLFLTGPKGPQAITLTIRPEDVQAAEKELRDVWTQILASVETDTFPTKVGKLCEWCSCKSICPAWTTESWGTLTTSSTLGQQNP